MKFNKMLSTVEVHTGGEAFRIVTSGLPKMEGKTIVEKRHWLIQHADHIRKALMFEPRGHADMYGGYLVDPVSPDADFGIIFLHNEGYSDHCGHGVIALATAAVELGWVEPVSSETKVGIDAPCGYIEAYVSWDGENANGVRFINVPSFIYRQNVTVNTPSFGSVNGDIAYGGAFYFYTDEAPKGVEIREENIDLLKQFGAEVKKAANAAFSVIHPDIPEINHIYGTIIAGAPRYPESTQANCYVFADQQIDRSPTGSGTAGRAAQLYMKGHLKMGEVLINESIIGTTFKASIIKETSLHGMKAVIPEVFDHAYI